MVRITRGKQIASLSALREDLLSDGSLTPLDPSAVLAQRKFRSLARKDVTAVPDPTAEQPPLNDSLAILAIAPGSLSNELIIGGTTITNVSLVVADEEDQYSDLAVVPVPVAGADFSGGSLLVAPVGDQQKQIATQPILMLPAENDPHIAFPGDTEAVPLPKLKKGIEDSKGIVAAAALDKYVLTGDIKDFFGIKGLTAKLYSARSTEGKTDEIDEMVRLQDMESPLQVLFPEIENKSVQELPLKNLQFTFTNMRKDELFPDGLRLEGDLELKNGLQFVSDGLKSIFGSGESTKMPASIHLSALIAKERDWTKRPKIDSITFQASLGDMKLPAWDILELQTLCLELSLWKADVKRDDNDGGEGSDGHDDKANEGKEGKEAPGMWAIQGLTQDNDAGKEKGGKGDKGDKDKTTAEKKRKKKSSWKAGYGLSGLVSIKVPNTVVPLIARYWIRMGAWREESEGGEDDTKDGKDGEGQEGEKDEDKASKTGKKYELLTKADEWHDFCSIANLDMKEAQLHAFFSPHQFKKSCTLSLTGCLEFAQGSLDQDKDGDDKDGDDKDGDDKDEEAKEEEEEKNKPATLKIEGYLSRGDYHFDARVGNLKLASILKIYAQITKAEPAKEAKEQDLVFEDLHLIISRKRNVKENEDKEEEDKKAEGKKEEGKKEEDKKAPSNDKTKAIEHAKAGRKKGGEKKGGAVDGEKKEKDGKDDPVEVVGWSLELSGKVSFHNVKSVSGLIRYDTTGLTIHGGVEDYVVSEAGVTIKEASIDIFIGAKPHEAKGDEKPMASNQIQAVNSSTVRRKRTKSPPTPDGPKVDKKPRTSRLGSADRSRASVSVVMADQSTDGVKDGENGSEEEGKGKEKVVLFNRASRFAIKGKVAFSGVTVTVAFMIKREETNSESKKASKRDWVLFGLYQGSLKLKDLCPEMEGPLAQLALGNIALIAASRENDTIEELNKLNYPVKKGVSFCATIPPLKELNEFTKQSLDGLALIATAVKGGLELQIQLPKAINVVVTDTVKLTNIAIGIEISKNPSLMVCSVLNILMESGQDPLLLEGMVKVGILQASASVATKSPWVNPFRVGRQVKITDFRVELEITYATLMELGPSKMGLAGSLEVGKDFHAAAAMSIGQHPDSQLLAASISRVDVVRIIRVAGEVAEIEILKNMQGAEDTFVITDASMYLSTGASIAGKEYERGISAGGKLTAFGKSGEFHLSIGEAGLDFKGFIDNFSLGPLVVSSATGGTRASMIMVMSKDQQVIKLDGMVTCFGVGLATVVDIQMGTKTPSFDAYLAVQFTEAFKISLHATVKDFSEVKDLAAKGLLFQCQVKGDLFELICEGIKSLIRALENLGTEGIEAIQHLISGNISDKEAELKKLQAALEEANRRVGLRRKERNKAQQDEQEAQTRAEKEIKRLENAVKTAQGDKTRIQKELEDKVRAAEDNKASLIGKKRKEYDDKLREAQRQERENRNRLEQLKKEQESRFGLGFLHKVDLARGAYWDKKRVLDAAQRAVDDAYWMKCNVSFWEVPFWAAELELRKVARDVVAGVVETYYHAAQALEGTLNSDAFQSLVNGIEDAGKAVERAANAVKDLADGKGFDRFIEDLVIDQDQKINDAMDKLKQLLNENSRYQKAIREAQKILNDQKPGLLKRIAEADEKIKRLEEDAELAALEREYNRQKKIYDNVSGVIGALRAGLETIKENWKKGMHDLENAVNELQKRLASVFHVEWIEVSVHTHALANNKPLKFTFYGTLADKHFRVEGEWAPGRSLSELYKPVANHILALA